MPAMSGGLLPAIREGVSMLDHFRVVRLGIVLRAREAVRLPPYAGSTLRGAFGHAFRRVACPFRQCPPCLVPASCPYTYIFETPPPPGAPIMGRVNAAPHPFVFEPPPANERPYEPGEEIRFGLVLVGRAIEFLPYLAYALGEMAERGLGKGRGKADLVEILDATDAEAPGQRLYDGATRTLLARPSGNGHTPPWLPANADAGPCRSGLPPAIRRPQAEPSGLAPAISLGNGRITIRFLTPTRLKFDSHLTSDLEFHILWRNLLRRLSVLSAFHCGQPLEVDFKASIARAEQVACTDRRIRWVDWERYSARQDTTMLLGGFMGEATFAGDLADFLPALRLGELVHVGKGTTFGLGQYRLALWKVGP